MGKNGGKRPGAGRPKGAKSRKTIERERVKQLERERLEALEKLAATPVDKAVAVNRKLMKEIGFDLTQLAAGLAAFYQPHPSWHRDQSGKLINANPNYDEGKFRYYMEQAMAGARDFSAYESPKLSAVLVGGAVSNEFTMTGGLPDEADGNLIQHVPTEHAEPAAIPATADQTADVPPQPGGGVPDAGPVQGNPVRKALG